MDAIAEGRRNLEIVQSYLRAIESGAPFEAVGSYFAPGVVQREFPNQLVPAGAIRGLKEMTIRAAPALPPA